MAGVVCRLLLVFVSAAFQYRTEAASSGTWNLVMTAYNTAYDNCKHVTDISSQASKSAADSWCEQAFNALDQLKLNYCSGWRTPACRPVEVDKPFQCTCLINYCDEVTIRSNIVIPFRECAPTLLTREQSSGRLLVPTQKFQQAGKVYDDALTISNLRRTSSYSTASQAGNPGNVQSSGRAGSFGGTYGLGRANSVSSAYDSGRSVGSSSMQNAGVYGYPSAALPSYAPGGVTAGPTGTVPTLNYCNQCGLKFESQLDLYDHKRTHHPVASDAHCYLCNITFIYRKGFKIHLRNKHPEVAADETERENHPSSGVEPYMPYACTVCRKRYGTKHGLRDHMKSHTTDDTTCHLCCRTYSTRANFKRHMTDQHPGVEIPEPTEPIGGPSLKEPEIGPYVCNLCGKSHTFKRHHKAHMKSHDTLNTYCIVCDRTLSSRLCYNSHMEKEHPIIAKAEKEAESKQRDAEKPVKCGICHRGFKNHEGLRHHKMFHEGKTNCDICGAKYKSRSALFTHKKNAHQK